MGGHPTHLVYTYANNTNLGKDNLKERVNQEGLSALTKGIRTRVLGGAIGIATIAFATEFAKTNFQDAPSFKVHFAAGSIKTLQ